MKTVTTVIPCFNEASRFKPDEFIKLLDRAENQLVLVNDGSRDSTSAVLAEFALRNPTRIKVINLERNGGKAEAVRAGLIEALKGSSEWVGYVDADLATPIREINRMIGLLEGFDEDVILGSRVKLLGTNIQRKVTRHYLGRVFATFTSIALNLPVYDTQCGAKFFRANQGLTSALDKRFLSKWVFDVELIGRLLTIGGMSESSFREVPLAEWKDVGGSKLTIKAMFRAFIDLARIGWSLKGARHKMELGGEGIEVSVPKDLTAE